MDEVWIFIVVLMACVSVGFTVLSYRQARKLREEFEAAEREFEAEDGHEKG